MSDELKITKQRVLAAAERCSDAKNVLKELFPEVFENWELTQEDIIGNSFRGKTLVDPSGMHLLFWLHGGFNWKVEKSNTGNCKLIPTRK